MRADGVDYEIDAVLFLRLDRRRRQVRTVETRRTMHMLGRDQRTDDRMRATGEDGNIRPAGQFHQFQAVGDGVIEVDVAGGGDQSENLERLLLPEDRQDGSRLVLTRIG